METACLKGTVRTRGVEPLAATPVGRDQRMRESEDVFLNNSFSVPRGNQIHPLGLNVSGSTLAWLRQLINHTFLLDLKLSSLLYRAPMHGPA